MAGFAIEFAGKRDPFRWRRAPLWHFIPAYNAHAREATGTGATSCVSTGDISIK